MSLLLTLNRNICASILLLISNCIGIYPITLQDCEKYSDRNLQSDDEWEAKDLCSRIQSPRQPVGTTPLLFSNTPSCVPWTPDLIASVQQTSFDQKTTPNHFHSLKYITDKPLDTCATTGYERESFINVTLKSQVHIYAVRIATRLGRYKTFGKFPLVYVVGDHGERMDCDDCMVPRGPQLLDVYCPTGTVGNKIVMKDVLPGKCHFIICDLKIYLGEEGEDAYRRKMPETTTPFTESKAESMSSTGMSMATIITIAALCCVVLLVIAFLIGKIILTRKKSCPQQMKYDVKSERVEINEVYESDDVYQPVADYQPEYHIYNTVVYEEIGPRPDLLESCDNIYSEPDDPKMPSDLLVSTRFRENEVYTNPDSQGMLKENTDCELKIKREQSVDSEAVPTLSSDIQESSTKMRNSVDSITRFRENEVYTIPNIPSVIQDNTDYYVVAGKSNTSSR